MIAVAVTLPDGYLERVAAARRYPLLHPWPDLPADRGPRSYMQAYVMQLRAGTLDMAAVFASTTASAQRAARVLRALTRAGWIYEQGGTQ